MQNEYRYTRKPRPLTEFISDDDFSGGFRGLAHTGGVAAAHTEAVGFTLSQVKKCEAWRLDWHTSVHPLPRVCP